MPKTVTERPDFEIRIRADAGGLAAAHVQIVDDGGSDPQPFVEIDVVAASVAEVTRQAGLGLVVTAAQVRAVWKGLAIQAYGQGKTARGYA